MLVVTIILWIILIVVVVVSCVMLYLDNKKLKEGVDTKLTNLVNNINNAQYYEYTFDKQQERNIRNVDRNVTEVATKLTELQDNIRYLNTIGIDWQEKNSLLNVQ